MGVSLATFVPTKRKLLFHWSWNIHNVLFDHSKKLLYWHKHKMTTRIFALFFWSDFRFFFFFCYYFCMRFTGFCWSALEKCSVCIKHHTSKLKMIYFKGLFVCSKWFFFQMKSLTYTVAVFFRSDYRILMTKVSFHFLFPLSPTKIFALPQINFKMTNSTHVQLGCDFSFVASKFGWLTIRIQHISASSWPKWKKKKNWILWKGERFAYTPYYPVARFTQKVSFFSSFSLTLFETQN